MWLVHYTAVESLVVSKAHFKVMYGYRGRQNVGYGNNKMKCMQLQSNGVKLAFETL